MKIDGLIKSSERGFERHLYLVDDDKQKDFAGWSVFWAGQPAKSWHNILVIAVLSFSRNYFAE